MKTFPDLQNKNNPLLITENEVLDVLGSGLPGINSLLEKTADSGSVYKVM